MINLLAHAGEQTRDLFWLFSLTLPLSYSGSHEIKMFNKITWKDIQ